MLLWEVAFKLRRNREKKFINQVKNKAIQFSFLTN